MEHVNVLTKLPTTAETEAGPVVERRLGEVSVRYDHEDNVGAPVWVTVRFNGAIGLRYTTYAACTALMVRAYSAVGEVENSEWVRNILHTAAASEMPLLEPNRHFIIYFDHYGCVEVVAASFEVEDA